MTEKETSNNNNKYDRNNNDRPWCKIILYVASLAMGACRNLIFGVFGIFFAKNFQI